MKEFTNEEICREVLLKSNKGSNIFCRFIMSFPFQAITVGMVYLAGYFSVSPAWLLAPLFLSVLRDTWRVEKELAQRIAMAKSVRNDKTLLFSSIDKLPPWIVFPDVDRCEWFNIMVSQFWPTYTCYLVNMIEDELQTIMKATIPTFRLKHVKFGSVPPRISGVKVYEEIINRNEIMIDMNVYYAGDCDFSFVVFGLSGGIKNFQMRGWLRLHVKPLLTKEPFLGGMELYFLRKPTVDFNLAGVVNLLSIPGLNDVIHTKINEYFSSLMVSPNKLLFSWSDSTYNFTANFPIPVGVLRINVLEAVNLVEYDVGIFTNSNLDPYVTVSVGTQNYQSESTPNTSNPKWDFWAEFIIDFLYRETILIEVTKGEDNAGDLDIEINLVKQKGVLDQWFELENVSRGKIHLRLFYFQLSPDKDDYYLMDNKLPYLSSSVLVIYIDSAQNLVNYKSGAKPNTVIRLAVGNTTQTSKTVFSTNNPVFRQGFMFLVNNPELDKLHVYLIDIKDNKDEVKLGNISFNIGELLVLKPMEVLGKRYSLINTATDSSIVLSLRLKTLQKIQV